MRLTGMPENSAAARLEPIARTIAPKRVFLKTIVSTTARPATIQPATRTPGRPAPPARDPAGAGRAERAVAEAVEAGLDGRPVDGLAAAHDVDEAAVGGQRAERHDEDGDAEEARRGAPG